MKTSPQLELIIENIRDLCRGQDDEPETLAALLWLLVDSEDCRRVLEAASPTGEDLDRLCALRSWSMKTSPRLEPIIEKIRDLCRGDREEPKTLATLLWLLIGLDEFRRALEAASPTGEDLERLCARLGQPARAWVQFSPRACELLNRPVLPSRLRHPATLSRRASSHVHTASGRRPRPRVLQLR